MRILPRRFEVALFERDGDVLREADADEAAGGDRVAVANQRDGFARGDDLAVLERVQRFEQLPLVGRASWLAQEAVVRSGKPGRDARHCDIPSIGDVVVLVPQIITPW